MRDITETRRSTEETIQSEKLTALTLLAAGVAHEIGNPLNSLHIHLQLMERKLRKVPPAARSDLQKSLDVAREEITRLGAAGVLKIEIADQWMPDKGQTWRQFRGGVMERIEKQIEKYHRDSLRSWNPIRKRPSFHDLRLLARYQSNHIQYPADATYKRIRRTAAHLGLKLRPKNQRTKKS